MQNKALVVIDIQNDITKNYKEIIGNINNAIDWATENNIYNIAKNTRYFSCEMNWQGFKSSKLYIEFHFAV